MLLRDRGAYVGRFDYTSTYALYDDEAKTVELRRLRFDFDGYIRDLEKAEIPVPGWCRQGRQLVQG